MRAALKRKKSMNAFFCLATFVLLLSGCARRNLPSGCYKGRLEVKGLCANYTIKLLEGNLGSSKLVDNWKDDVTGKAHSNVFALGNTCSFPDSLNEGDEFYFVLNDAPQQCAVCLAYYPRPQKSLSIKVLNQPCR